jgi:hypothetical protein
MVGFGVFDVMAIARIGVVNFSSFGIRCHHHDSLYVVHNNKNSVEQMCCVPNHNGCFVVRNEMT